MKKIYAAADLPQAHLLLHLLEEAGIEARILNENMQGGTGEIPFIHTWPEIWLENANNQTTAEKIIREFENRKTSNDIIACPDCGEENPANFESCWQCGATIYKGTR